MINPQELRLGNWVGYDSRYFKIHSIADIFPTLNTTEFGIGVVDYNNIYGIPLTPTILEKCGGRNPDNKKDTFGGILIKLSDLVEIRLTPFVSGGYYWNNFNGCYKVIVKYLHQLQNLIHALTQEELQIDSII